MKQKRIHRKLSPEKEELFTELKQRHNDLVDEIEKFKETLKQEKKHLLALQEQGRVSASNNVYAGVKIYIKDEEYKVTSPFDSPITFLMEDNFITIAEYEDITEEDLQRRD
jgi:uncharacterized protein (DUF342 family)